MFVKFKTDTLLHNLLNSFPPLRQHLMTSPVALMMSFDIFYYISVKLWFVLDFSKIPLTSVILFYRQEI